MRTALLISNDVHTIAWINQALARLDLAMVECEPTDLQRRVTAGGVDVVIADGGRSPMRFAERMEAAAEAGAEAALLLVVDADSLAEITLPARLRSDFFVRGGTSEELAARVRALLWPGEEVSDQELVRVGDMTVNLATYQAYVSGEPVDFTYLEYALFAFLVTHPGRTYSREALLRRVWGTEYYGGSRTVDVHVRRIRSKIGGELSERLETVRNVGYLWRA